MALKSMNTLIKLHKRRVDAMRREMIVLEEERRQLLAVSEKLAEEHKREMELAAGEPKIASFFGAYSERVKKRREKIAEEVKRLDKSIIEKAEAIQAEFGEQKKYEIARENAKKRMEAEARARLQQRFDEIGSQQYVRAKGTI